MKKLLLAITLLFMLCNSAFASAVITINDVPPHIIRNTIINDMVTYHSNYVLQQQTDNMLKFVETKDVNNILFMGFTNDTITYIITPNGKNTTVSLSENVLIYQRNGVLYSSQVPHNEPVLEAKLIGLKAYFNGIYRFGYSLVEKIKDGYTISVDYNSACEKAGMRSGDILLSVNGNPLKKIQKKYKDSYALVDMFSSSPATFKVVRDGTIKMFTVTPVYYPPTYKPEQ